MTTNPSKLLGKAIDERAYKYAIELFSGIPEPVRSDLDRKNVAQAYTQFPEFYGLAENIFKSVIQVNSKDWEAFIFLALLLLKQERINEGLRFCEQAFLINPNEPEVLLTLGFFFVKKGQRKATSQVLDRLRRFGAPYGMLRALELQASVAFLEPFDVAAGPPAGYSSMLDILYRFDSPTAIREYAVGFSAPRPSNFVRRSTINRVVTEKIRVGFAGGDFYGHPLGHLFSAILSHKKRLDYVVYDSAPRRNDDVYLPYIKRQSDLYREVQEMTSAEAAEILRKDRIDVLVDLSGWTEDRATSFLYCDHELPIVNYLGFPATQPDCDFIIVDEFINRSINSNDWATEELIELNCCYQPFIEMDLDLVDNPNQSRLPRDLKMPKLVSLCNPRKITTETLKDWADILDNTKARLSIYTTKSHQAQMTNFFESRRLENRVHYFYRLSRTDYMAMIRNSDMFLDTAPYGGHTTVNDCLRHDLPFVALAGKSFHSLVSASILHHAGFDELIAHTHDEYIKKYISILNEQSYLEYREKLSLRRRERFGYFDTTHFVNNFENSFSEILKA